MISKGHKLLLADDSVTIRHVVEATFAGEAIEVVTVSDGAAAIARLEAEPPDVVLADIGMPGQDGYAVALHVRRTPALAHIPVILLTGAFDPVDYARAREAGCAGVLVKPFDPQMLVGRVRQLLGFESPPGAAAAASRLGEAERSVPASSVSAGPPYSAGVDATAQRAGVEDYFERLDRAFASLGRAGAATPPDSTLTAAVSAPTNDPAVSGRDEDAPGTVIAGDIAHSAIEPEPSRPTASTGVETPMLQIDHAAGSHERQGLDVPSPPALRDAFTALLAMEQGHPLPKAAGGWMPAVDAAVMEQIARGVAREIAEVVIRDLAPEIVSQVAERLVREEIARLPANSRNR